MWTWVSLFSSDWAECLPTLLPNLLYVMKVFLYLWMCIFFNFLPHSLTFSSFSPSSLGKTRMTMKRKRSWSGSRAFSPSLISWLRFSGPPSNQLGDQLSYLGRRSSVSIALTKVPFCLQWSSQRHYQRQLQVSQHWSCHQFLTPFDLNSKLCQSNDYWNRCCPLLLWPCSRRCLQACCCSQQ